MNFPARIANQSIRTGNVVKSTRLTNSGIGESVARSLAGHIQRSGRSPRLSGSAYGAMARVTTRSDTLTSFAVPDMTTQPRTASTLAIHPLICEARGCRRTGNTYQALLIHFPTATIELFARPASVSRRNRRLTTRRRTKEPP
jgi:hypothetical protein